MFKMINQDYITNLFRITIVCENYRFDADIDKSKNDITAGSNFLSFQLFPEELDSVIEKLQKLKSMIGYNKKDNE